MTELVKKLDFKKSGGLIPAIIQDAKTQKVLMFSLQKRRKCLLGGGLYAAF